MKKAVSLFSIVLAVLMLLIVCFPAVSDVVQNGNATVGNMTGGNMTGGNTSGGGSLLISSVTLTVTPPAAGSTSAVKPDVALPDGAHYEFKKVDWAPDSGSYTFQEGKSYKLKITLIPALGGYYFDMDRLSLQFNYPGAYNCSWDPKSTDELDISASITLPKNEKVSLKLKKVTVKKSAKKLILSATLKINGKKAKKGTKVTFVFNGKKFTAKTDKKGVAKVTVKKKYLKKLKVGKKITYQVTYGGHTVKRTVKVKK